MSANTLGQRIKELRMKLGWTQIELAEGICTPSMISQIESDRARPSYKILFALSDKLEVPLERLLADVEMNLEFISNFKMARSMVASKEYGAAIPLLEEMQETPRGAISTVEILSLLSECYLHTEAFEMAESMLDRLKDEFTARRDFDMLSVIYNRFGVLAMERKQYEIAVYHFENALNELAKVDVNDVYVEADIHMNLGHVREKQGKLKQAIDLYEKAQKRYASTESPQEMATVYSDLARTYQRLNEPERSMEYSDLAYALFRSSQNTYMGVKAQMIAAIASGQCGNEKEAIQTLKSCIKKFQNLGNFEDVGIAYTELAKLQLALDSTDDAEESSKIARSWLPELHPHQAWVNRILGEIEVKAGNIPEAIRRLQMAGDCFKLIGELDVWAETMAELSKLKIQENDLSSAVSILETIRLETRNALTERGIVL